MKQKFRFRYVNEVVGGFVLLSGLILVVAVYSIGHVRGFYGKQFVVELRFKSLYSIIGLQEGAEVRTRGSKIGRVSKLDINDPRSIRALLRIDSRYRMYVPKNATAKVARTLGITGEPYVEISSGRGDAPPIREGAVIVVDEKSELPQTLEGTILRLNNLIENGEDLLANISDGDGMLGTLITDKDASSSFLSVMKNLELVTEHLAKGKGSAGQLLMDDSAVDSFEEFTKSGTRVFGDMESGKGLVGMLIGSESVADEFQNTMSNVSKITESLNKDVDTLGGLLYQLDSAVLEFKRLVQQMQRSWVLPQDRRKNARKRILVPSEIK